MHGKCREPGLEQSVIMLYLGLNDVEYIVRFPTAASGPEEGRSPVRLFLSLPVRACPTMHKSPRRGRSLPA